MWSHDGFIIGSAQRNVVYVYAISRYIFRGINIPRILHPHADIDIGLSVRLNVDACTITDDDTNIDFNSTANISVNAWVNVDVFEFYGTLQLHADSDTNTARIIVLLGWVISAIVCRWSRGYTMRG